MTDFPWPLDLATSQRLGETILHSLWQVAALTATYALAAHALRRGSAQARYLLGCSALALMALAPLATFAWLGTASEPAVETMAGLDDESTQRTAGTQSPGDAGAVADDFSHKSVTIASRAQAGDRTDSPEMGTADQPYNADIALRMILRSSLGPWLPWVSGCWMIGVAVFAMRPLVGLLAVCRLRRHGVAPAPPEMNRLLNELSDRLRVRSRVELALSTLIEVPTVVGFLRPLILLPVATLAGLTAEQLELILAHELAHIRRHDYMINALQTGVETMLFYHPGVWWVSSQVREERENCCDDVAVALSGNHAEYVRALVALEQQRVAGVLAIAATGGSLLRRARRLLSPAGTVGAQSGSSWLAGLLPMSTLAALLMLASAFAAGGAAEQRDPGADVLSAPVSAQTVDADPAPADKLPVAVPSTIAAETATVIEGQKTGAAAEEDKAEAEPATETNISEIALGVTLEGEASAPLKIELFDNYSRPIKTWKDVTSGEVNLELPQLQSERYRLEISAAGYATANVGVIVAKDGLTLSTNNLELYRRRYAVLKYVVNLHGERKLTGPNAKSGRVAISFGGVPDLHGDWLIRQSQDTLTFSLHRMQQGNGFAIPAEEQSFDDIDVAPPPEAYQTRPVQAEPGLVLVNRIIGDGPQWNRYAKILVEDITDKPPPGVSVIDTLQRPTLPPPRTVATQKSPPPTDRISAEVALTTQLEDAAEVPIKVELLDSGGKRKKTWTEDKPGTVQLEFPPLDHDTYTLIVSAAGHSPERIQVQVSADGAAPLETTVSLFRPRYVVLRYAINTAGERNLSGKNIVAGRTAVAAGKVADLDDWTVLQRNGAPEVHTIRWSQNAGFAKPEEGTSFEDMDTAPETDDYAPADFPLEKGMLLYNRVVGHRPQDARYAKLLVEDITETRPKDLKVKEARPQP